MTSIVEFDSVGAESIRAAVGPDSVALPTMAALRDHLEDTLWEDSVVLGPSVDQRVAFELAEHMRLTRPSLGVILIRRRVDTPLLTEALRAGVREVLLERDVSALPGALKRVKDLARALRDSTPAGGDSIEEVKKGRIVTVFSAKGGCGKTTLSTNLAAGIAASGRGTVALVDLDLAFGDVSIALQIFPEHTIADAVPHGQDLDGPALASLMTQHKSGLKVLAAPHEPSDEEKVTPELVTHVLTLLRDDFDYVVVDTPPALTDAVLAAFDMSDVVALLATLDIPALKNLKVTLKTLDDIGFSRERCRVVLNRADAKVGLDLSEVEKTIKAPIASQVPSSREVPTSTNKGVPLITDQPKHPVSVAIRQFTEAFVLAPASEDDIPIQIRTDRRLLRRKNKG